MHWGSITLKYWRNTLEVTPDGTYVLRLKDLRDGAECAFRAWCGITDGKKVFKTFRLREEVRRFKLGELRSADILQSEMANR